MKDNFSALQSPEAGFTLVELLVSLVIMSGILVFLGSGIRLLSSATDASAARLEAMDERGRAFGLMRRDGANLRRVFAKPRRKKERLVFVGSPQEFSFVVLEPPYPTQPALYFVRYRFIDGAGGVELVRERVRYEQKMDVFPGATPANSVSLMRFNGGAVFSYGAYINGRFQWFSRWTEAMQLPSLVRVELPGDTGLRLSPTTFIVKLQADAEMACLNGREGPCSVKIASDKNDRAEGNRGKKDGSLPLRGNQEGNRFE